ncbi:(d)CMP kinase [Arenicella xantha]|uniref:Cytidylate kinase n=1 Tax=Arenicella xantha TaxID=644221 RepID=A0A395JL05_9GAMM|nr:(d)CMP kinase [Arenicella xantha]RBP51476.1 cytidylate kinase [Arenicella xantha]
MTSNRSAPVLALDGPSGSGKGTIGQICASQFGWHYLDSGAIYRGLAWLAQDHNVSVDDVAGLVALADSMELTCHVQENDVAKIEINGQFVTAELRTEETGEIASQIAPLAPVRASLLAMQRRCRKAPGLVADGRDMGTVVFPDAEFKVFLTASAQIRAQRRFDQLKSKGFDVNLARLLESIQARDVRDSSRAESPLKPADNAYVLDTSDLSIDEVVASIMDYVNKR